VPFGGSAVLSVDVIASNIFNIVQFQSIDTVLNSPTFGEVTAARASRRMQFQARVRF
jgi:hypothetical protein